MASTETNLEVMLKFEHHFPSKGLHFDNIAGLTAQISCGIPTFPAAFKSTDTWGK